jgi:hypothetical protein
MIFTVVQIDPVDSALDVCVYACKGKAIPVTGRGGP